MARRRKKAKGKVGRGTRFKSLTRTLARRRGKTRTGKSRKVRNPARLDWSQKIRQKEISKNGSGWSQEKIIMPLPIKRKNESKDDFISRCMSSEVMQREFPKRKQRLAICYKQWRNK